MTVLQGIVIACVILIAFGVLAAITAVIERLPTWPPYYVDNDDVLPPPNPRSVVRRRWQVPE